MGPNWDRKGRGLNEINVLVPTWQDIRPRTGPRGVQLGQEGIGIESNKCTHMARCKATYRPTWGPTVTGKKGIESNKCPHMTRYKVMYQPTWGPTGTGREED